MSVILRIHIQNHRRKEEMLKETDMERTFVKMVRKMVHFSVSQTQLRLTPPIQNPAYATEKGWAQDWKTWKKLYETRHLAQGEGGGNVRIVKKINSKLMHVL